MKKLTWGLILFAVSFMLIGEASAASKAEIDREVDAALQTLYETTPGAKELAQKAKGILVFPKIVKGGIIIGGQYGNGALLKGGKTAAYYRSFAASYGLQFGVQTFGYALFFMTNDDLGHLERSKGWEAGVGPTIVALDSGKAGALTTTTGKSGVYAYFFSQRGLMAGISLEGTKINEIHPD